MLDGIDIQEPTLVTRPVARWVGAAMSTVEDLLNHGTSALRYPGSWLSASKENISVLCMSLVG